MITTRVEGFDEATRALSELSRITAMNTLRRALMPAAEALMDAAVAAAPELTGDYKASYRVEERPKGRKQSKVEVHVLAEDVAAAAIEYGTSDTPAHGTFRRTSDGMTDTMVGIVGEAILTEVAASAARAAKKAGKAR